MIFSEGNSVEIFVKGAAEHGITKWQLFLPYRQLCFHVGWTKFQKVLISQCDHLYFKPKDILKYIKTFIFFFLLKAPVV